MDSSQRRKQRRTRQRSAVDQGYVVPADPSTEPAAEPKRLLPQSTPIRIWSGCDLESHDAVLSVRQRAASHLPYWCVILLAPLVVLCAETNPIFPPADTWYVDTWVYLGFFRNFSNFEAALFPDTYYGSRLSWILPGALAHHIFQPVMAAYVLHLLVYFVALFSLYYVVAACIGRRTAVLSAMMLGLYPYFWAAIGWDYVDGAGIAYYLLTTALLTKAAFTSRHRLILFAAGVSFGALLYSNIAWTFFTPVLALHYLGLRRPTGKSQWAKVIVTGCLWPLVGLLGLTLILCTVNQSVGGRFWFYRPSVMYALHTVGQKNRWYREAYAGGLPRPWLWFPILTLLMGLFAYLLRRVIGWQARNRRTTAVFTLELLIASTMLVYLQMRGSPWLGLFYYASYLIPLVFLATAPLFWPNAEELQPRWFAVAVAAVIVLGAAGWWVPATSRLMQSWSRPENHIFIWAAGGALLGATLLQRYRFAIALSVAAFGLLNTAVSFGRQTDTDLLERSYQRVMKARQIVEKVRGSGPIRWWYNQKESNAGDFTALSSTYLWGYTLVGLEFPNVPQKLDLAAPTLLAVVSSRPNTAEAARVALAEPLKEQGLVATQELVSLIQDRSVRYTLVLMKIERQTAISKVVRSGLESVGTQVP